MSGRYEFGMRQPIGPCDTLPCGALPGMAATFGENVISPADYQQGIISSGSSGSQRVGPQT